MPRTRDSQLATTLHRTHNTHAFDACFGAFVGTRTLLPLPNIGIYAYSCKGARINFNAQLLTVNY